MKGRIILVVVAAVAVTTAIIDGAIQRRRLVDAEDRLDAVCEVLSEQLTAALRHIDTAVEFDRVDYSMRVSRMGTEIRACTPSDAFDYSSYDRAFKLGDYAEMKRQITTAVNAIKEMKR